MTLASSLSEQPLALKSPPPKQSRWCSYEETSEWAHMQGIKSQSQWNKCKTRPQNMPARPDLLYLEEFDAGGWGSFLKTGAVASQKRQWATYSEASKWAQENGITGLIQWREWSRQKRLPSNIPSNLHKVYIKEFKEGGMDAFLGLKRISGVSKVERCLRHVLENVVQESSDGIKPILVVGGSGKKWEVDVALFSLRLIVEYDGWFYHKEISNIERDGRKVEDLIAENWSVVRVRGHHREFRQSILRPEWDVVVREYDCINIQIKDILTHLLVLLENKKIDIPEDVRDRMVEWKERRLATYKFRDVLMAYDNWATYEEASEWAKGKNIKSKKDWYEKCKDRPSGVPFDVQRLYSAEFMNGGWGRFLGKENVKGVMATYDEASAWAQAHKVWSQKQWKAIKYRPAHIPAAPDRVYPKEFEAGGGWGGFLATGALSNKNKRKGFATYAEASAWAQAHKIWSQRQWRAAKNRPAHIPSNPSKVYWEEFKAGGGWKGFLGTKFVTYAEASAWAQQQGIQTFKEWRARCQQGLPPHIPADLLKVYRDEWMKQGGAAAFFGPLKLPVPPIPAVEASPSPLHEPPRSRCRP